MAEIRDSLDVNEDDKHAKFTQLLPIKVSSAENFLRTKPDQIKHRQNCLHFTDFTCKYIIKQHFNRVTAAFQTNLSFTETRRKDQIAAIHSTCSKTLPAMTEKKK